MKYILRVVGRKFSPQLLPILGSGLPAGSSVEVAYLEEMLHQSNEITIHRNQLKKPTGKPSGREAVLSDMIIIPREATSLSRLHH